MDSQETHEQDAPVPEIESTIPVFKNDVKTCRSMMVTNVHVLPETLVIGSTHEKDDTTVYLAMDGKRGPIVLPISARNLIRALTVACEGGPLVPEPEIFIEEEDAEPIETSRTIPPAPPRSTLTVDAAPAPKKKKKGTSEGTPS